MRERKTLTSVKYYRKWVSTLEPLCASKEELDALVDIHITCNEQLCSVERKPFHVRKGSARAYFGSDIDIDTVRHIIEKRDPEATIRPSIIRPEVREFIPTWFETEPEPIIETVQYIICRDRSLLPSITNRLAMRFTLCCEIPEYEPHKNNHTGALKLYQIDRCIMRMEWIAREETNEKTNCRILSELGSIQQSTGYTNGVAASKHLHIVTTYSEEEPDTRDWAVSTHKYMEHARTDGVVLQLLHAPYSTYTGKTRRRDLYKAIRRMQETEGACGILAHATMKQIYKITSSTNTSPIFVFRTSEVEPGSRDQRVMAVYGNPKFPAVGHLWGRMHRAQKKIMELDDFLELDPEIPQAALQYVVDQIIEKTTVHYTDHEHEIDEEEEEDYETARRSIIFGRNLN